MEIPYQYPLCKDDAFFEGYLLKKFIALIVTQYLLLRFPS